MKILIATRAKLSLLRAHSINILKTAEYLSRLQGVQVQAMSFAAEIRTAESILEDKGVSGTFMLDVSSKRRSAIWHVMRTDDYDLLYFRDPWLVFPALYARYAKGKKIVFEVHGSHEWRFLLPLWRFAVRVSHGTVFITKKLATYYHIKKPYAVVPTNAVTLDQYHAPIDLTHVGVPSGATVIMYCGSFLWYSVDVLLEMMRELQEQQVHLVLVGPTAAEEEVFKERAASFALNKRYTIVKRVRPTEVPGYLCAADILVNPLAVTYPSSVSSKLYEYLAAGKPIITSAGGANEEVIEDGVNGIIVPELSGAAFAQAVVRVLHDPEFATRLSSAAYASASRYTWEGRAERIYELIQKIAQT